MARLIHQRSLPRGSRAIIPLCCPLMDAELLQTTIRAFLRQFIDATATDQWPTLLLVDVDQLPDDAQRELAGLFQLPDFELFIGRHCGTTPLCLARQGRFLPDLAETLCTLVIDIPALADRREDIPLLVPVLSWKSSTKIKIGSWRASLPKRWMNSSATVGPTMSTKLPKSLTSPARRPTDRLSS